ncbi:hypothetical protein MMC28_000228 [Mycoblastus sanguinarius]|nr:hypothetical protein [Mycoblastus sanguinarius]
MPLSLDSLPAKEVLSDTLVPSSIWKLLCIVLIIVNFKNLPLIWHVRLLNAFRFVLRSERSRTPITPAQLFQPLITESHGSLMELDYNIHKSNSTYFQDVDIARTHLICTLFSAGIEQARRSKGQGLIGGGNKTFGVALGAVCCSFRKEINPFEKYEMWTRVMSWDRKWLYMVTHFVRKDAVKPRRFSMYPNQKNKHGGTRLVDKKEDAIIASALSKIVFKKGRLTIPPEVMLQASGLLPPRPADLALLQTQVYPAPTKSNVAQQIFDVPFRFFEKFDLVWEAARNSLMPEPEAQRDHSRDGSPDGTAAEKTDQWTWEKVEEERVRGMEMANKLGGLDGLASEFTAEADALGKHSDLYWFLGLTY